MTLNDFVREVKPIVYEIICDCLKMSTEEYQKYKVETQVEINKLCEPQIMNFWQDIFSLIESYRSDNKSIVREAAACKK